MPITLITVMLIPANRTWRCPASALACMTLASWSISAEALRSIATPAGAPSSL